MGTFCYRAEIKAALQRVDARIKPPDRIQAGTYVTFDYVRFRVDRLGPDPDTWILTRPIGGLGKTKFIEITKTSDEIRAALGDHQVRDSFDQNGRYR